MITLADYEGEDLLIAASYPNNSEAVFVRMAQQFGAALLTLAAVLALVTLAVGT